MQIRHVSLPMRPPRHSGYSNADDATSMALTASNPSLGNIYTSRRHQRRHCSALALRIMIVLRGSPLIVWGEPLIDRNAFPHLGDHNVANALAASLAVIAALPEHRSPVARQVIAMALTSFRAPPHRLELVGEWHGVQWINDSKATNVSSTYVAIGGMTRPTILLLGGRHKGEPYTGLIPPIRAHVTRVIAYGEAAPIIARDLHNITTVDVLGTDFAAVVAHARAPLAIPGDTDIAPRQPCSSYDMFTNYEERGIRFRELAHGDG